MMSCIACEFVNYRGTLSQRQGLEEDCGHIALPAAHEMAPSGGLRLALRSIALPNVEYPIWESRLTRTSLDDRPGHVLAFSKSQRVELLRSIVYVMLGDDTCYRYLAWSRPKSALTWSELAVVRSDVAYAFPTTRKGELTSWPSAYGANHGEHGLFRMPLASVTCYVHWLTYRDPAPGRFCLPLAGSLRFRFRSANPIHIVH